MSIYHRMFVIIQFAESDDGINDETRIRNQIEISTEVYTNNDCN